MKFNKEVMLEICKIINTIEKTTYENFNPRLEIRMDTITITIFTGSHCSFPSRSVENISAKSSSKILEELKKWHSWLRYEYGYRQ